MERGHQWLLAIFGMMLGQEGAVDGRVDDRRVDDPDGHILRVVQGVGGAIDGFVMMLMMIGGVITFGEQLLVGGKDRRRNLD